MLRLFYIELIRSFVLNLRYPANFVSSLVLNTLMFYGLFMGAQYLSGQQVFGERLDTMVVGYSAWVLVTKSVNKTPMAIQQDADTGVLESLFLSGYRKDAMFLIRALAESVSDVVTVVLIVSLLVLFTGSRINLSPWVVLPVATLVLSAIGIGMLIGAFALQVKRVSAILPAVQLLTLALMFTPFESLTSGWAQYLKPLGMALPMVPSVVFLRQLLVYGTMDPQTLMQAVANAVGYVVVGIIFFNLMIRRVKRKGLLGGH
ncbi:ABC transporter permease [Xanthomonas sp. CFBP 8703]|uniref:ABC transporter permease n=1 Tax=Xanthomonas bonasiae TaxID=2810351 RepID=A0ABS3AW03_9XANT|nr:ABC transporter permease [Xanthomonas bonasiae]MBN6100558.1 ABC transporter permease [Xanthomonas bonasiae]MBN6111419.1 ABC transporter permease [Xanthomonas bonasiae]